MTLKYVLIGLYVMYVIVMLSILLWGNQRLIYLGAMFFPLLIILQVYYILRHQEPEDPGKRFNDWYQNK